ncbi:hypothetical protein BH10ACT3_BH10ACT3_02830 [soil metagenome]
MADVSDTTDKILEAIAAELEIRDTSGHVTSPKAVLVLAEAYAWLRSTGQPHGSSA